MVKGIERIRFDCMKVVVLGSGDVFVRGVLEHNITPAVILPSSAASPADEAEEPTEVFAVAGVDAVPGVAGVAVAVSEYEVAASPAGAGATMLRSIRSARSPVGAKYFAMMELIPLLLLSSSEKSS